MAKQPKTSKCSPEELLKSFRQEEIQRYGEEQQRLRAKAAQELKEYNQRRVLLIETAKFFRKLEKSASDNRREQASRKEWADILSCQKFPSPASAPELRECLFRWTFQQEAHTKSSASAALTVYERSQLMPDPGQKRATRKYPSETYRNIGGIYLPAVREALAILESIEDSGRTLKDEILLVRDEIRKFISDSLDRMTFRIGSNVGSDMETLDPLMSEFHFHELDVLAMFLWSFRHVPLPTDYNLLMRMISMTPLSLTIHRPLALDLKDSLIRGLWLGFDHYSSQDPTRTVLTPGPIPELISSQETEWNERQDVRRKRLTALNKQREEYEAWERCKREEAEASPLEAPKVARGAGNDTNPKAKVRKGIKKSKQPFQSEPVPPLITDGTEVDIDAAYECEESARFWAALASVGPDSLPLAEGYMNLREYAIVGGVYELARFDKLPQPIELRPDFMYTNVPVGLQLSGNGFRAVADEEFIKIELRLPKHCCWWDQPTVCCWEPWEESERHARLRPDVEHLKYSAIEPHNATLLCPARKNLFNRVGGIKIIHDFELLDIPEEVRLHYLICEHILPRLPEGYRFRPELKRLFIVLKDRIARQMARRHEQVTRNEMMLKYDRFLDKTHYHDGGGLREMRLPNASDIGVAAERSCEKRETKIGIGTVKLQEMDEKLQQFSLGRPDVPHYLHPPIVSYRPLAFVEFDHSETAWLDELGTELDELALTLESPDTMLDDMADERLCRLFSTFLRLLEYLGEKEKPKFPPLPSALPSEENYKETPQAVVKRIKRRYVDIRTTKKYPLGLGSRKLETSAPPKEKKKGKRKNTPVCARSTSQPQVHEQVEEPDGNPQEHLSSIEHRSGRWSTKPISRQSYDANQRLLTFWTDRLGVYGLGARKYCHLPFSQWEMRRHGRVVNLTTIITLRSPKVDIVFYVTSHGFRVQLREHVYNAGQVGIAEMTDFKVAPETGLLSIEELEKYLHKINVHVFPEVDTCFYTAIAPKHESMEMHNLRCLGAFCLTHNFARCLWNEFANRRTALVLNRQLIEGRQEPEFETIMITPLKSQLVEVEELCSSALEEVLLAFHPRPAEQSYYADCYGLLRDGLEEPSRKILAKTPPLLQWNVGLLLQKLRLLSYS